MGAVAWARIGKRIGRARWARVSFAYKRPDRARLVFVFESYKKHTVSGWTRKTLYALRVLGPSLIKLND